MSASILRAASPVGGEVGEERRMLAALRDGDSPAFLALVGRYHHAISCAATPYTPRPALAEDGTAI